MLWLGTKLDVRLEELEPSPSKQWLMGQSISLKCCTCQTWRRISYPFPHWSTRKLTFDSRSQVQINFDGKAVGIGVRCNNLYELSALTISIDQSTSTNTMQWEPRFDCCKIRALDFTSWLDFIYENIDLCLASLLAPTLKSMWCAWNYGHKGWWQLDVKAKVKTSIAK